jgi:hypothetical protein
MAVSRAAIERTPALGSQGFDCATPASLDIYPRSGRGLLAIPKTIAKAKGVKLGRRRIELEQRIRELHRGQVRVEIGQLLGVGTSAVQRMVAER